MCMFLYGGIDDGVHRADYDKLKSENYHFNIGSREAILDDLNSHNYEYTITQGHCDCGTHIGQGNANHPEVKKLVEYINTLQSIHYIKWICVAKKWWDDDIEENQTVHINDIDLPHLLANVKEKCLYEIQMFRKYY